MPNPDVLMVIGAVAAILAGFAFFRFPAYRKHIVIGCVVAAGAAAFVTWYTMFRVDDPTYTDDKAAAEETQKELDELVGDGGFDDFD